LRTLHYSSSLREPKPWTGFFSSAQLSQNATRSRATATSDHRVTLLRPHHCCSRTRSASVANSLCCNAINLITVALEPDLPHAFDNHHKSRRWRNITCDSRSTTPSTPPSETSTAAPAESPLRLACHCKKPLPRRVLHHGSRVWGCADRGSVMSSIADSKHFGFRVLNPRESKYQDNRKGLGFQIYQQTWKQKGIRVQNFNYK